VQLDDTPIPLDELPQAELAVLPQPGHTPGSCCLLVHGRYLFTGDHLAWSAARDHLLAHRLQCWENCERQTRSVDQLARWARDGHISFRWVLPGHGEWVELAGGGGSAATADALDRAVMRMREQPRGNVPLARWIPFSMSRTKPGSRFARLVGAVGGSLREAWLLPRAARYLLPDHPSPTPTISRPAIIAGTFALSVLGLLAAALA
jgi:glyoxylase-like metal-dependent hydrolase (beta-lactamase superfamily II)